MNSSSPPLPPISYHGIADRSLWGIKRISRCICERSSPPRYVAHARQQIPRLVPPSATSEHTFPKAPPQALYSYIRTAPSSSKQALIIVNVAEPTSALPCLHTFPQLPPHLPSKERDNVPPRHSSISDLLPTLWFWWTHSKRLIHSIPKPLKMIRYKSFHLAQEESPHQQ